MTAARLAGVIAVGLLAALASEARGEIRVRARMDPPTVRLGEKTRYGGELLFTRGELVKPQWVRPDSTGPYAWGPMITSLSRGVGPRAVDTLRLVTTVQAFELGTVTVPGVVFVDAASAVRSPRRLPSAALRVVSVLTPADSNADLRPVRGPIPAPWWERVPWAWVVLALATIATVIWIIRRARKRRPVVAVPVAPTVVQDPAALARARLAELRARRLPEAGEFSDHALALTSILRRYLEATVTAGPPGDTTTELTERLQSTALRTADVQEIDGLLRLWDRVKFARAEPTAEEAHRHENEVEAFIRRHATPAPAPPRREAA